MNRLKAIKTTPPLEQGAQTARPASQLDASSTIKPLECARAALEKKAENLKILNLSGRSSLTDFFVICSGSSDRQVKAIAESVQIHMKKSGYPILAHEGTGEGRWVLLDFGDVIVHVFLDVLREYYDLENLWRDAPRLSIPQEYYSASIEK